MPPLVSLAALEDFVATDSPATSPLNQLSISVEVPGLQELIAALTEMRAKARGVQPLPG